MANDIMEWLDHNALIKQMDYPFHQKMQNFSVNNRTNKPKNLQRNIHKPSVFKIYF